MKRMILIKEKTIEKGKDKNNKTSEKRLISDTHSTLIYQNEKDYFECFVDSFFSLFDYRKIVTIIVMKI